MPELFADAAGEVEAEAGGLLVLAAVAAGEAALAQAGQVLGRDADARVLDDERAALGVYPDAAGRGVLERVGEQLLYDEGEPLLVRQHLEARLLKVERQLPEDEHLRVLPHAAAHDLVKPPAAQQEVGALALQPLIAQHHAHVLLYPEELGGERALLPGGGLL